MKKLYSFLIVSIVFSSIVHAQNADVNFLKRQYNAVQDDLKLIKQCYLSKSPSCNENEKRAARIATLRIGAEITGLVVALAAIGTGTWYAVKKLRKPSGIVSMLANVQKINSSVTEVLSLGPTALITIHQDEDMAISDADREKMLNATQRYNKTIQSVVIKKVIQGIKVPMSSGELFDAVSKIIPEIQSLKIHYGKVVIGLPARFEKDHRKMTVKAMVTHIMGYDTEFVEEKEL